MPCQKRQMNHSVFLISLFVRGFLGEVAVLHLSGVTGFDSEGDGVVGLNKHSSVLLSNPAKRMTKSSSQRWEISFIGLCLSLCALRVLRWYKHLTVGQRTGTKFHLGQWTCHNLFLQRFLGNFNLCHCALFCRLWWPWLSECGGLLAIIPVPSQKKHSRKSAQMAPPFPPFSQLIFGC